MTSPHKNDAWSEDLMTAKLEPKFSLLNHMIAALCAERTSCERQTACHASASRDPVRCAARRTGTVSAICAKCWLRLLKSSSKLLELQLDFASDERKESCSHHWRFFRHRKCYCHSLSSLRLPCIFGCSPHGSPRSATDQHHF